METSNLIDVVSDFFTSEIDEGHFVFLLFNENNNWFLRDNDFHIRVNIQLDTIANPRGIYFEKFEVRKKSIWNIDSTKSSEIMIYLKEFEFVDLIIPELSQSVDLHVHSKISNFLKKEQHKQLIEGIRRDFESRKENVELILNDGLKQTQFEHCLLVATNANFKRMEAENLKSFFDLPKEIARLRKEHQTLLNVKRKRDLEIIFGCDI